MNARPKLLVVNPAGLGPVTFSSLLGDWPDERIRYVSIGDWFGDLKFPGQTLRLPASSAPIDAAFRKAWNVLAPNSHKQRGPVPESIAGNRLGASVLSAFHEFARGAADASPVFLSQNFWNWVFEFAPTLIYSPLGSLRMIKIVNQIACRTGCSVVPHYMDDWPTTLFALTPGCGIWRSVLLQQLRILTNQSSVGMAISLAMASEYQNRFGVPFEPFMNSVEVPYHCPTIRNLSDGEAVRLVYIGGLHLNRWASLHDIGFALKELESIDMKAELVVYAPTADLKVYGDRMLVSKVMKLGGSLKPTEVRGVLAECEIAVHVESFDSNIQKYTRLSISTKLPQYFASARPVLGYGPIELASFRYVAESRAGLCVGNSKNGDLKNAFMSLIGNPSKRIQLGANGWRTAMLNHRLVDQRERFCNILHGASILK